LKPTSILVALNLCLFSLMATANDEARDYLAACREARKMSSDAPPSYQAAYCLGTTGGVLDTLQYMDELVPRSRRICLPEALEPGRAWWISSWSTVRNTLCQHDSARRGW